MDITLYPGEGLRELKTKIRDAFGKYRYHILGKLQVENGGSAPRDAKKEDLVNGTTLRCVYTYQAGNGNLGNFGRSRNNFAGRFFGFGGGRRFGGMFFDDPFYDF